MSYWRIFIISCVLLLTSCAGGADLISGVGSDLDLNIGCYGDKDWTGTWEGTAVSDEGNQGGLISLSMNQDKECDVTGAVVYQPCVPVTTIDGRGVQLGFRVQTDRGFVVDSVGTTPNVPISVGTQQEVDYTFINTQNVPNCPQSDKGTALLTKTS